MKKFKTFRYTMGWILKLSMQLVPAMGRLYVLLIGLGALGCSQFVEVDPPKNTLVAETVFNDPSTVESALANVFHEMREQGMVSGNFGLMTALGIYSDELEYYGTSTDNAQLFLNGVMADNGIVLGWWTQAYSLIYAANDIIVGVQDSEGLTLDEKNRFMGQALFVRAYIHSLLVAVYGDVPYVTTTDYLENNKVSRLSADMVRTKIVDDLVTADGLLEGLGELSGERVLPDHYAVKALLARMYLYTENWQLAGEKATELMDSFGLEMDLDQVFLKESQETIWQLKPGESPRNTQEANQLIIQSIPGQDYALTETLLGSFEPNDLRFDHWIDSISDPNGTTTLYFAHKYKARFTETEPVEYSIVFRLAEQVLIRAEARARMGNIDGASSDLNSIRNRAGLADTSASNENQLLEAILRERQVELFTERGHRWFDLKRFGKTTEALAVVKPGWDPTDVLLPIPEKELEINPNLLPQNTGY